MRFNLRGLILWYLIYYFLIAGVIKDLITKGWTDSLLLTDSIYSITGLFVFFLGALISYSSLYKYYPKKNWTAMIVGIALSFIGTILFRYFIEQMVTYWLFDLRNYNPKWPFSYYIRDNYHFVVPYIIFGIIYFLIRYSIYSQNREKDLLVENQKIQLSALRNQINPHFLLNSLNNIYSLVYHKSEAALPAMDKLTDILKYTLYENKELISIEDEINIVHKYVNLQKLRSEKKVHFKVIIDNGILDEKIPQFLILPIIENAFKHGIFYEKKHPITLKVVLKNGYIIVNSSNKIHRLNKDSTGGVGLANLKKRLALMFDGDFVFHINEDEATFEILIKFPKK